MVPLFCHISHISPQYGLVGSTEFAEDFPDWIVEHVVAYINNGAFEARDGRTTTH